MSLRSTLIERLKQIGRNVEIADAAAVGDLLEIHDAARRCGEPLIDFLFLLDILLEVAAERVVVGIVADVELPGALRVDLWFGSRRPLLLRRRRQLLLLLRLS